MPNPIIFAQLAEGDQPASLLDDSFQWLSGFVLIPCQAVGQNSIQLFPFADAPIATGYTDLTPVFTFAATQTNTGNVTLNVMSGDSAGLGQAPAYKNNGAALVEDGEMIAGCAYQAAWLTSLNNGAGGFVVNIFSAAQPPEPKPPFPPDPIPGGDSMPINMIWFTTGNTYTPSPGMVSCIVECVGGGGGGGGAFANGTHAGGGGGSGGYSRALLSAADIGANQPIIIGAGGTAGAAGNGGPGGITSFGNLCIANGGQGGGGDDGVSIFGVSGAPAAAGSVHQNRGIALPGNGGGYGFTAGATTPPATISYGGAGAAIMGGGPAEIGQAGVNTSENGNPGQFGAGGTGAIVSGSTTSLWVPGGAGGAGWCCVTEYS